MFIHNNITRLRQKLCSRDSALLRDKLAGFAECMDYRFHYKIDDVITIASQERFLHHDLLEDVLLTLKPWRKGPFDILGHFVKSEWDSAIKFNLIKNHLYIQDKIVADIGCNNGYYMFRLLPFKPCSIVGFDPSTLYKYQFDFLNSFIKSDIVFEMLGLEDLAYYDKKFDVIMCLGVLYHRSDPITSLKILKNALSVGGEMILDSIIIEDSRPICISPLTYAKMKNAYFIPSIAALHNWAIRAGFKDFEILALKATDTREQSKSEWINGESLEDFLDKDDSTKTIEGYPAPIRAYIKLK